MIARRKLVVDASAAVNALLGDRAVLAELHGGDLMAPTLIDTEVLSAFARLERQGAISADACDAAIANWQDLACARIATGALNEEVWRLRHRVRIADAHYVVLALAMDATLLTSDKRLAGADIPGLRLVLAG
ncbi:Predicted nucleic acid-binding protein, contains PIN domain [Micrococcales bacterium KH10]|nr:Predicted nucleic acid-binding protein, contains PIN domain [Micrococcales bacterium KH10]